MRHSVCGRVSKPPSLRAPSGAGREGVAAIDFFKFDSLVLYCLAFGRQKGKAAVALPHSLRSTPRPFLSPEIQESLQALAPNLLGGCTGLCFGSGTSSSGYREKQQQQQGQPKATAATAPSCVFTEKNTPAFQGSPPNPSP